MAGKIIYGFGKLVGNTAGYSVKLTGNVISSIAEISGNEKLAINTKEYATIASKGIDKAVKITAAVTAVVIDKTIDVALNTAQYIEENAVETKVRVYGQSEKFYDKDKYIEVNYEVLEK
ncbi:MULTISPECIES: hypothetical protein [unclassified Clostridium]|nr:MULTISPECIES: hypothetical protein [unclassified Clostridium]MBW9145344.1 hypothetical protein [Clostridium sp. CM027]UVE42483.1 hypothetical protein KTC92_08660 [Clostridium sp. CM027]WLC63056.1 hypothetical protein KTC94_07375 [Clostridium sp. CM028]